MIIKNKKGIVNCADGFTKFILRLNIILLFFIIVAVGIIFILK